MDRAYVVARFDEDGDGRTFAVMRDTRGYGAFESIDDASAMMTVAEESGAFDGSYFRIVELLVKEA